MFDALLQRKQAEDKRQRLNAGIIAAMIYNTAPFGDDKREPMKPTDFVPGMEEKIDLSKMSPEAQRDYLMNQFFNKQSQRSR